MPIEPPISSIRLLDNVSPSPVPSVAVRSAPTRSNGMNTFSSDSGGMPCPVSATQSRSRAPGTSRNEIRTLPPIRLYLIAFERTLSSTCVRRCVVGEHASVQATVQVLDDVDPALLRERAKQLHRIGQRAADVHRLDLVLRGVRLDARDLEHLVDEREQVAAGHHDPVDRLAPRSRAGPGAAAAARTRGSS